MNSRKAWKNYITKKSNISYIVIIIINRYNELFVVIDSCEAHTNFKQLTVPNVFGIGSSLIDEKAYSDTLDDKYLSVTLNDK